MEPHTFNTFRFFRTYFGIPSSYALQWCVVEESSPIGRELRLGVQLKGTKLYIDVAMRRFFHEIDCPAITRRCFPAKRIAGKTHYNYRSSASLSITWPKSYIRDIYASSVFNKELIGGLLL